MVDGNRNNGASGKSLFMSKHRSLFILEPPKWVKPMIGIGSLLFAMLAWLSLSGGSFDFDRAVMAFMNDQRWEGTAGWFEEVVRDITALGSISALLIVVLIVFGYELCKKNMAIGIYIVVAFVSALLLNVGLKELFDRTRPGVSEIARVYTSSFPSAHAMLSTVVFLTLAVITYRSDNDRIKNIYIGCVAGILSLLVGVSRIYLGVHWATDIISGWLAGVIWALMCWVTLSRIRKWYLRNN